MKAEEQPQAVTLKSVNEVSRERSSLDCPDCHSKDIRTRSKNRHGNQTYYCNKCGRYFTANYLEKFVFTGDPKAEYKKDIWDIRNLGIQPSQSQSQYKLNFTSIKIPWVLETAKHYIRYSLTINSYSNVANRLQAIKHFSAFLHTSYPELLPASISRSIAVEFLSYMTSLNLNKKSRADYIGWIKNFLELCARENWANVPDKTLFYPEDFPSEEKHLPRYIPEEVINQLNQHLDELPEPIMRMSLVLQETGMRRSELCLLKLDCLLQDTSGDWFLLYYQFKMKKEHTIPISRELTAVVQEQQKFIRSLFPSYEYLFCSRRGGTKGFKPEPRPVKAEAFITAINQLAKQHEIKTLSGHLWHFQNHQFRHTVSTKMINSGVPIIIVKRYLGHESFDMTSRYAHIHDQTLKEEIAKFLGKVVNISGQIVEPERPELDSTDLQWFKRNVQAQALPNGSCALPAPMKECPHANACLTCTHFRTTIEFLDQHKQELAQTKKIIEKAKANGWQRQVEMNQRLVTNLQNIINSLEASDGN